MKVGRPRRGSWPTPVSNKCRICGRGESSQSRRRLKDRERIEVFRRKSEGNDEIRRQAVSRRPLAALYSYTVQCWAGTSISGTLKADDDPRWPMVAHCESRTCETRTVACSRMVFACILSRAKISLLWLEYERLSRREVDWRIARKRDLEGKKQGDSKAAERRRGGGAFHQVSPCQPVSMSEREMR